MRSGCELPPSSGCPSWFVLGQAIERAPVLRDDTPAHLKHLRSDFHWREHHNTLLDAWGNQIALVEVCCAQGGLIQRHGQAVALPTNLHYFHETLPFGNLRSLPYIRQSLRHNCIGAVKAHGLATTWPGR